VAVVASSVTVGAVCACASGLLAAPADDAVSVPSPGRLDGWLRIEKDETIRVFTGKAEIGMGVQTALSQIVAEELDAPFEHLNQMKDGKVARFENKVDADAWAAGWS